MNLNQEIWRAVDEYLNYEVSNHGRVRNAKTGCILKHWLSTGGYFVVALNCKNRKSRKLKIHKLVAFAFLDNPNNYFCVDHLNRDRANNMHTNLRYASLSQNGQNRTKKKNCSSEYIGVSFNKKTQTYVARITNPISKKSIYIGSFENEIDGAYAYDIKARELFGVNAKTNF